MKNKYYSHNKIDMNKKQKTKKKHELNKSIFGTNR